MPLNSNQSSSFKSLSEITSYLLNHSQPMSMFDPKKAYLAIPNTVKTDSDLINAINFTQVLSYRPELPSVNQQDITDFQQKIKTKTTTYNLIEAPVKPIKNLKNIYPFDFLEFIGDSLFKTKPFRPIPKMRSNPETENDYQALVMILNDDAVIHEMQHIKADLNDWEKCYAIEIPYQEYLQKAPLLKKQLDENLTSQLETDIYIVFMIAMQDLIN